MRRADAAFLLSVGVMAGAFLVPTIARFTDVLTREAVTEAPPAGKGGTPRDVDIELLRRLLRARRLSEREALFYERRREEEDRPSSTR